MASTTTSTTFITEAVGFIGTRLVRVFHRALFRPALLLALPFAVGLAPQAVDSTRTIDITLSRYAFSPERIEVLLGEPVRLNVVSADGAHGFQVKELGLNVRIPAGGKTVTVELTPNKTGMFTIRCSEYCGRGHDRMKALLIVTPGT